MTELPSSIEAMLAEAGFTGTEIIIIRACMRGQHYTLRELAVQTSKSTGVLDSAVKKLAKKGIIQTEYVNATTKYALKSLDVVRRWLERDAQQQQALLRRRQENFEHFVQQVEHQPQRQHPHIEHFEGQEGLKNAYALLLDRGTEMVMYGPPLSLAADDPIAEIVAQFHRRRQTRELFCRAISHDTPLGRRVQSRDALEFRKTILVSPDAYPFLFQKIILGDTVACIQHDVCRASFIRYPELAQEELLFFERIWLKKNGYAQRGDVPPLLPSLSHFLAFCRPAPTGAAASNQWLRHVHRLLGVGAGAK